MAAPSGTTWGSTINDKGRIGIYAGVSSTATQTTVNIEVWFWSKYSVSDSGNTYYYNPDATSASTSKGSVSIKHTVSSGSGWSTSNQTKLGSYTYTYNRGTSAVTHNYAAKLTGIDVVNGTMTCTKSITVPKKDSYTVSYNANGGSNAPTSQTKWYGTNITLSSSTPTRTGYTFGGWATSSSGGVSYTPGATYSANSSITLYAVWSIISYTVRYDANGGSGAPGYQTKNYGSSITLSTTKPTRTNYNFKGWATSSTGGVSYASGATYSSNANITLYAVWELAYVKPKITNLKATRCNSDGTASETGTYAKITFNFELCQLTGANTTASIAISWSGGSATGSASGASGSFSKVVGGSFSGDSTYSISVSITDAKSGTTSQPVTLPGTKYIIDRLKGGNGISFGGPATESGITSSKWLVDAEKGLRIHNRTSNGSNYPNEIRASSDPFTFRAIDAYKTPGAPTTYGSILEMTSHNNHWQPQLYISSGINCNAYIRNKDHNNNSWGSWRRLALANDLSGYSKTDHTHSYLPLSGGTLTGALTIPNETNGGYIICKNTSGATKRLFCLSSSNNLAIGYDIYVDKVGNTNIYAGDKVKLFCRTSEVRFDWASTGNEYTGYFIPGVANTVTLGTTSVPFYRLYAKYAVTVTSDEREKHDILAIKDVQMCYDIENKNVYELLFERLIPKIYCMNSVNETDNEKIHIGFVAQDVAKILNELGIEESQIGIIEHEFWIDEETGEQKDKYGLCYTEFIPLNTYMIQKQQKKLNC